MAKSMTLWEGVKEEITKTKERMRPKRAFVGVEDNGRATVAFIKDGTVSEESYAKLEGPPIDAGKEVLMLPIGDNEYVILGPFQVGPADVGGGGGGLTAEDVRDTIGTALVAGANVTITVNDVANTITIDASSGISGINVQEDTTPIVTATTIQAWEGLIASMPSAGIARITIAYGGSGGNFGTSSAVARSDHAHSGVYQPSDNKLIDIAALAEPGTDYIIFWDGSAALVQALTLGTNLSISGTTLNATGSSGAPTTATYIVQTSDGTLSNEQALNALATGLLKVTTGTGVLSTATAADLPNVIGAGDFRVEDTRFMIQDNTDPTKQARIGASNITAGAVRNFELPPGGAANLVGADSVQTIQNKTVDSTNTIDLAAITGLAEYIRDTIGTALVAGTNVTITVNDGADTITVAATGGGGAPTTATYIVQTSDGTLSNEQALSSLSTGLLKVTTGTGVLSTATGSDIPSHSADLHTDGSTNHVFTAADDTKLGGIATGATANDTDANLKARANHTGTQAISTVTNLQTELDAKQLSTWEVKKRQTPAATTTANTATTGNLTALSLPVGASEIWAFDYFLPCACSGTGGTRFTFSFSGTSPGLQAQAHGNTSSLTAFRTDRMGTMGTLTTAYATFADATGTSFVRITGTLTNVGAGTLQIQHASGTAGQTSTVYAGAYLVAHRIA